MSIIGLWFSGVMLFVGVIAFVIEETQESAFFIGGGIVVAALCLLILALTDRPKLKSRAQDGLAVAFLFWVLCPLVAQIPFWSYVGDQGPFSAYYEAISNLTTTGHSLVDVKETPLPSSLLIWRAVLHVFGALATITIAATVLAALNLGGPGIHRTRFFTIPEGSFFDTFPKLIRAVSAVMTAIIALMIGLLMAMEVPPREALSGAVSAITTGLVDPAAYNSAPSGGLPHAMILSVGLLIGLLGAYVFDMIERGHGRRMFYDAETVTFIGVAAVIATLVFMSGLPIIQSIAWTLSSLATSGIALTDPSRFDRIPLVVVFFPVLIGGAALSAAGGVKLSRLFILLRRIGLEFTQLGYRGSIQFFNFRGRRLSEQTIMGIWVFLVGYIVATVLGVLVLSITGSPFTDALRITIGSISNAGHVMAETLESYNDTTQVFAIMGMILGRLEVIALIPLLSLSFWRA